MNIKKHDELLELICICFFHLEGCGHS